MSDKSKSNPDGMRITRLPRNGPRPGQSTSAWL